MEIGAASSSPHPPSTNRSCFTLPNSHWTADTEGGSTESWGGQEELGRSRRVCALIASQYGKSFFKLFKKDLHTYACLEGEKKNNGSMPHNLSGTLLSEGRPRPSQSADIIVTYFCNSLYTVCTFLKIPGIQFCQRRRI